MTNKAIVYIFYDSVNKKYLIENRTDKQSLSGKKLFPGGKVNDDEINDLTKTLLREINEELGVMVNEFKDLNKPIKGVNGFTLYPFLITKWTGKIPEKVLDKGSILEWIFPSEFKPSLKPVKEILSAANDCVAQCY